MYPSIHPIKILNKTKQKTPTSLPLKDDRFTWEQPGIINWSWIKATLSHIVHVPAVKSHILLPLFEPPAVYQIPKTILMQVKYKHITLSDNWSPVMFMISSKGKDEEMSLGSGNTGLRLITNQNTMQHQTGRAYADKATASLFDLISSQARISFS